MRSGGKMILYNLIDDDSVFDLHCSFRFKFISKEVKHLATKTITNFNKIYAPSNFLTV